MEQAIRVLCIAGSPRRNGNSDRLLAALEAGVTEAGGVPVRFVAAGSGIAPCRGCNACSITGECVQRDPMDELYRLIDTADAIAVCTPVYFATVPAVLKTVYDRFQVYWARRYVLHEPPAREHKRPGAILVVGGGGDPFGTACAFTTSQSVFNVLGVQVNHRVEVVGPDSPTDISRRPDELDNARAIGADLVRLAEQTAP